MEEPMASIPNCQTTKVKVFKTDRLTDEERMDPLWNRQKPDRLPIMLMAIGFSGLNVGYTVNYTYTLRSNIRR